MIIDVRIPSPRTIELSDLLEEVSKGACLPPFHSAALDLLHELSGILLRDAEARKYPELASLGFWMRQAETARLRAEFESLCGHERRLNPRGTVFQIAAGNVDTLFVYIWAFALLTGNKSLVRLPSKRSPQTDFLCDSIAKLLNSSHQELRQSNYFVRYGHEREITAAFSTLCDVRTIWGGDATVNAVRSVPIGLYAKELCFPDRYSLSAISSAAYLQASAGGKQQLLHDFFNDAFWFGQMACSSPRLLVWCGSESENDEASASFFPALEVEARRREYKIDPATKMQKFLFACETVLDQPVTSSRQGCATVLDLASLDNFTREHCGGGLFLQYKAQSLSKLTPHLRRQDQTLTYFGFDRTELESFSDRLNGAAVDRIVPIGRALAFTRFWDGYDLLAEFTRSVAIHTFR